MLSSNDQNLDSSAFETLCVAKSKNGMATPARIELQRWQITSANAVLYV